MALRASARALVAFIYNSCFAIHPSLASLPFSPLLFWRPHTGGLLPLILACAMRGSPSPQLAV